MDNLRPNNNPERAAPKLSKFGWQHHVSTRLRTGDHALDNHQFAFLSRIIDKHQKESGGITRTGMKAVMGNLIKNRDAYHLTHEQIRHVSNAINRHIR